MDGVSVMQRRGEEKMKQQMRKRSGFSTGKKRKINWKERLEGTCCACEQVSEGEGSLGWAKGRLRRVRVNSVAGEEEKKGLHG